MITKGWTQKFSTIFWLANVAELLERAAFYGMFISLTLYLTNLVGFSDVEAGWVAGLFAALIYLLPPFAGAAADAIGFRKALVLAFSLLGTGYLMMGILQTKPTTISALILIAMGGSFVKSVITGTVAQCSDQSNRARAYSIFYLTVNIGAFSGKLLAKPLRTELGVEYINLVSSGFCFVALVGVYILYRNVDAARVGKTFKEILIGFMKVLTNLRFMSLILIVSGFWAIQHQMYATMPKYVLRMVGESAAPEWYANVNPLVVMTLVVPVTHLVRKLSPVNSISIALFLIPISALLFSLGPFLEQKTGRSISLLPGLALHPVTMMMVAGIALQGLAECFLSPRFLEYASLQAPKGEIGLYMGYSHLTSFFANLLGFGISGYLLEAWCPDPSMLPDKSRIAWEKAVNTGGPLPPEYANAHYIWIVFAGIGVLAFLAVRIFSIVTERIDRSRHY